MALLEVEDLSVEIGDRALVEGVSLSLEAGRVLGLVGRSGSGKSLTALAIMGLLPPDAVARGAVRLDGRDLLSLSDREMDGVRGRALGMVFQEPATALDPLMRAGDQVAETVRRHTRASRAEAAGRAADALARVGLPRELAGRYPHQLSGGQRQRVALAAATVLAPRVLIADEPTTALDGPSQAQVIEALLRLAREDGMALLLVSHDLALAAGVADAVAVMAEGRIVAQGPTRAVFADPAPEVQALLAAAVPPPRLPAPPAEGAPVLEGRGLVRAYAARSGLLRRPPTQRALDGVDLTLRRGEALGVVGESGAGKSTLARLLLGLERPDAGEVRLDGAPFPAKSGAAQRTQRRRIQAVFQDPAGSFDPRWRVAQLVAEPLALLDARPDPAERRRRVEAALAQVGLPPDAADRRARAFSGGQRQRIALARALIVEPDVLVLDEATSALDVVTRGEMLALLTDLRARLGLACLVIAHDLAVVRALCDRVLVLRNGRVVETGAADAVFAASRDPYTATLLAAAPSLDAALRP